MTPLWPQIKDFLAELVGFILACALIIFLFANEVISSEVVAIALVAAAAFFIWAGAYHQGRIARTRREVILHSRDQMRSRLHTGQRALVAEKMMDPIVLLDSNRRVVFANEAANKLLGKNLLEKDLSIVLRDPQALEAVTQTISDGKTRIIQSAFQKPLPRFFEITIAAITPKDQKMLQDSEAEETLAVVGFHDITTAKQADQMRTDFVANAGHELKTPLTSLLGFIETLSGPAKKDETAIKKFLPIMHNEAERMVRVIDDLLSLSRIEAQQHLPPDDEVSLKKVVKSVASTLDLEAEKHGITLDIRIPKTIPSVRGDKDQIFQMLQNLVANAIKYTRPNTKVVIAAKPVARIRGTGKPGVALSIQDQGEGIPREHIPRLTERFYRVDAARSRKVGGTGLGLAIVKHIVTRHQGTLQIESKVGTGTTVTVTLPQV